MLEFYLVISVGVGFPVPLTICSVICSDFEGIMYGGGYGEGIYCARVKLMWLNLPCHRRSGRYCCQTWVVWWQILSSDGEYLHPVVFDSGRQALIRLFQGEFCGVLEFIGGLYSCLTVLLGFLSGLGWCGWVQCCVLWLRAPFQRVCDMLIPSLVLMSSRHDNCRNIRNLLRFSSSFSLNPVLMKSSMSRESFFHCIFIRGMSFLYQNVVIPH